MTTNKRFTIDLDGFIYDNGEIVESIIDLLNDLNDKNEELKSELRYYRLKDTPKWRAKW